ncbi:hypothetical protein [Paraburkholderia elongata]|uniref:Uncharacterized protein n=1 Tax=Paraburkholderia elongata TaxID=2675747 RepID=A0A972NM21_9BURK|nr:hypothetical protein [Paraburkholderia elongata]NPT54287.1 hypothetical protein [Paraburkholderia elongata]
MVLDMVEGSFKAGKTGSGNAKALAARILPDRDDQHRRPNLGMNVRHEWPQT